MAWQGRVKTYAFTVGGRPLSLTGPARPDDLLDEPGTQRRFERDGYMPYWAQPWAASLMLAEHLLGRLADVPQPVLELGAGLGLVGIALARAGHRVVVSDYDGDALAFVRRNARLNGARLAGVCRVDWRRPPPPGFAAIVAADVLYERDLHRHIIRFLRGGLEPGGRAFVCDPDRLAAVGFAEAAREAGLGVAGQRVAVTAVEPLGAGDGRTLTGTVYEMTVAG